MGIASIEKTLEKLKEEYNNSLRKLNELEEISERYEKNLSKINEEISKKTEELRKLYRQLNIAISALTKNMQILEELLKAMNKRDVKFQSLRRDEIEKIENKMSNNISPIISKIIERIKEIERELYELREKRKKVEIELDNICRERKKIAELVKYLWTEMKRLEYELKTRREII